MTQNNWQGYCTAWTLLKAPKGLFLWLFILFDIQLVWHYYITCINTFDTKQRRTKWQSQNTRTTIRAK
jgi:hypothetical protein